MLKMAKRLGFTEQIRLFRLAGARLLSFRDSQTLGWGATEFDNPVSYLMLLQRALLQGGELLLQLEHFSPANFETNIRAVKGTTRFWYRLMP